MTTDQATYRYFKVFIPAMVVYGASSVGITQITDNMAYAPPLLYALALIPILAVLCAFWAHWRFAIEIDEFLRFIQIKATLFSVACVMVIASGWGTLEMLADVPNLQVFWLLPIFWISHSAATVFFSKVAGVF